MTDWKAETGRVLEEIRRLIRESDLSQRKVEERAGFSKGYLSQLLARNLDLKVWHVLAILDVLGRAPGELFEAVFPRTRLAALEQFRRSSQPLGHETDEVLSRLYRYGVESLDELRGRLERCEEAIDDLERRGLVEPRRRSGGEGSGR